MRKNFTTNLLLNRKRKMIMIFKVTLPILISTVIALVFMIIVRNFFPSEVIKTQIETWGIFFAVFGIIYAIIVGFLLVEVLRRYYNMKATIERELNAIEDTRDFLVYLDENQEVERDIRKSLLDYVNSVVSREWAWMEDWSEISDSDTSPELYQVMEAVHKIRITNESDNIALSAIIDKVSKLTEYRTERLDLSDEHLSPALRFLILFMSIVLVVSFALMAVESVWIHAFMVFSNVIAINLLYLVITDLNHPFEGLWNIRDTSFRRVAARLAASLNITSNES